MKHLINIASVTFLVVSMTSCKNAEGKNGTETVTTQTDSTTTKQIISTAVSADTIITATKIDSAKKPEKTSKKGSKGAKTLDELLNEQQSSPKAGSAPPRTTSPSKSKPPTISAPPSESEGMGGAPPSNEDMEMMPEAPKGIRNPVGPNKSNTLKKQKPK